MNLIVFDVEGTLTVKNPTDRICFQEAAQLLLQSDLGEFDFSSEAYSTDTELVFDLWNTFKKRNPTQEEFKAFQDAYYERLKYHYVRGNLVYKPMPGAKELLRSLVTSPNWKFILTSSSWSFAAEFKLKAAGFYTRYYHVRGSEDKMSYEDVISTAIQSAETIFKESKFKRTVYIGDDLPSLKACSNLQIPYMGMNHPNEKKDNVLARFARFNIFPSKLEFLRMIRKATVPSRRSLQPKPALFFMSIF
jgi:phosphoglycolate phosphatase-like HAD superfamily hydrolase